MKPTTMKLYFQDEFRNIKCGWRQVQLKHDDQYAYVRPIAPKGSHWSRMPINLFNATFGDYLVGGKVNAEAH